MLSWTLVTEFDDKKLQLVVSTRQMQVPLEPPQTIVEVSRVFYYQLVCTVASLDTQCIVSNFESERYISRVGRDGPLHTSLPRYVRYLCGTYGTEARHSARSSQIITQKNTQHT